MKFDPEIHHRRSIRLKGYDYTQPGAYFVTLCAYRHDELFGEVVDGEMRLSPLGEIIRAEWLRSAEIRKEISLFDDEFVIMPNHLHGIVWIVSDTVGADGVRPNGPSGYEDSRDKDIANASARRAPLRRAARSLSSFIAGFKCAVTSRAGRELILVQIWQWNYYEHIIRSEAELESIRSYIVTNPRNGKKTNCTHPRRQTDITRNNPLMQHTYPLDGRDPTLGSGNLSSRPGAWQHSVPITFNARRGYVYAHQDFRSLVNLVLESTVDPNTRCLASEGVSVGVWKI